MKIGSLIGHYHVVRRLGKGGMGAVYVANDTKLNRKVALKVLPTSMASNPEWLSRFEREAQAVAALNHPNIVTIHSVEEADDLHFITLELVGGKTLDQIVPDGGLDALSFLDIAIPLADAVAAAHKKGIAHRDLKPANVMVTDDEGRVKVLDFGVAKLIEGFADDEAATQVGSEALTEEGKIVGTVAYMSPEQAEGKAADHRSDIFSTGILMYEMATGDRPFQGDTKLSILASIVKDAPVPIAERNAAMPRHLARIVKKALEKDLSRRYQSMIELRNDLVELKEEIDAGEILTTGSTDPYTTQQVSPIPQRLAWLKTAGIAVGAFALAALAWSVLGPGGGSSVDDPPGVTLTQLTTESGVDFGATVSPDGQWFAFARQNDESTDLYLQSIGSRNAIPLGVSGLSPAFSPDGTEIAFSGPVGDDARQGGGISIMGRTGDDVRRLTEKGFNPSWSPDGSRIVYGREFVFSRPYTRVDLLDPLMIVDVATAETTELPVDDGVQPSWSPNGHRVAYWGSTGGQRDLFTVAADGSGEGIAVTNDPDVDFSPVWSPDGEWLYFASTRGGPMAIWRVRIDERSGEISGDFQQVTSGGLSEPGMLSISADGNRLVYTATVTRGSIVMADFDPERLVVSPQTTAIVEGARRLLEPDVSPDGEWIVYRTEGAPQDMFIARAADGSDERQITDDVAKDWIPRFSPDSRRVVYYSNADTGYYEIWVVDLDGSRRTRLTGSADKNPISPIWSPDGARIAFNLTDEGAFLIDSSLRFDQQEPVPMTVGPEGVEGPAPEVPAAFEPNDWSDDGSTLVGQLNVDGIWLFEIETEEYRQLAPPPAVTAFWMADNRRVLFQEPAAAGRFNFFVVDSVTLERWAVEAPAGERLALSPDNLRAYLNRVESESQIWMAEIH